MIKGNDRVVDGHHEDGRGRPGLGELSTSAMAVWLIEPLACRPAVGGVSLLCRGLLFGFGRAWAAPALSSSCGPSASDGRRCLRRGSGPDPVRQDPQPTQNLRSSGWAAKSRSADAGLCSGPVLATRPNYRALLHPFPFFDEQLGKVGRRGVRRLGLWCSSRTARP